MEANKPKVSVVVVPRERFSLTHNCVEHIYAYTDVPFELILIDVGCPEEVSKKLQAWEKDHSNMKIIRTAEYVYPYEAKNIGLKHISPDSEWVAFIDSDVMVYPHWMTKLLEAAQQTGARVVHPLYLIDDQQEVTIHMADGIIKSFTRNGKSVIQPIMNYVGRRLTEVPKLKRIEGEFLEFHMFMVRRDLLREVGDFEPIIVAEDVNWSMRVKENNSNEKIVFEPESVTRYIAGPPFKNYDLPYFRFRWNKKKVSESNEYTKKRWPQIMPTYWDSKMAWVEWHSGRISPLFATKKQWNKLKIETSELFDRAKKKAGRVIGV